MPASLSSLFCSVDPKLQPTYFFTFMSSNQKCVMQLIIGRHLALLRKLLMSLSLVPTFPMFPPLICIQSENAEKQQGDQHHQNIESALWINV